MESCFYYPTTWTLTEEQEKTLKLFCKKVEELFQHGNFPYPFGATIKWHPGRPLDVEAKLPPEILVRSTALGIRHFYAEKEKLQFYKIYNILFPACQDEKFKQALQSIRKKYSDFLRKKIGNAVNFEKTIFYGVNITSNKELLDTFFNGDYFHTDEKYSAFIENIDKDFGPILKQEFTQILYNVFIFIRELNVFVKNSVGIDQLAQSPIAQEIQEILSSHTLGPTFISICELPDGSEVQCNMMDLIVTDEKINVVGKKYL